MSAEIIGLGAFLFVSLTVGGWRIINAIDAQRARAAEDRRRKVADRANRSDYSGPMVNHWGREMDR